MHKSIFAFAFALGLAGGTTFALAQEKSETQRVEPEKAEPAKPPQQAAEPAQPAAEPNRQTAEPTQPAAEPGKSASPAAPAQQSAEPGKSPPTVDAQKSGALKKENPVPPPTGRNLPEQGGKQEGSSKVVGTNPNPTVLEKGVLTAPGARTDVDTAPAKYSKRTDRDDQLPIAEYRLRHLSGDQRREILAQLGGSGSDPKIDVPAKLGAQMPPGFDLDTLAQVPEAVAAKFPELRGAAFVRVSGKAVIVDLDNLVVIGVLEG